MAKTDEKQVEHVAIAMREAYAKETGETSLVPFAKSRARGAWLNCARAGIEALRQFEEA